MGKGKSGAGVDQVSGRALGAAGMYSYHIIFFLYINLYMLSFVVSLVARGVAA